jgi:hypothetical protein
MVASDDPRESLNRLINWHVAVALDPCVSSDAKALVGRAAAAERKACIALVYGLAGSDNDAERIAAAIRARSAG